MITHSKTLSSGHSVYLRTDVENKGSGHRSCCATVYCETDDKLTKTDKEEVERIVKGLVENTKHRGETEIVYKKWKPEAK